MNGQEYEIRDTIEFEVETFGLTKPIPIDYYEVVLNLIVGAIASGKSTLALRYYANRINDIWTPFRCSICNNIYDFKRDVLNVEAREYNRFYNKFYCYHCQEVTQHGRGVSNVDNFLAEDIHGVVEAVKNSTKLIHYIVIDDSVPMFDSRLSMSKKNINATQMYFEIRHELERHAEMSNGNAGGLVVISIITQDYKAIDKRLREASAFVVFKTYDPSCLDFNLHPEIVDLLKLLKDKSSRVKDDAYRKLGVGIDCLGAYTLFKVEKDLLPVIEFKRISAEQLYEQQRDRLVEHLLHNINLFEIPNEILQAELYFQLDEMKKKKGEKVRISPATFREIIIRAKGKAFNSINSIGDVEDSKDIVEDLCETPELKVRNTLKNIPKDPKKLTIAQASLLWLFQNGRGRPKDISKGINKDRKSVKAELYNNPAFVNIEPGVYTYAGSVFDTKKKAGSSS